MKKINKTFFLAIFGIVTFFLSSNAYAVEGLDLQEVYRNSREAVNKAHGVETDDFNVASGTTNSRVGAWASILVEFFPEGTSGNASIQESDLPTSTKRGIYGMAEDAVNDMYQNQPLVNVYAHLAEEWVPGYTNTSVYAAESDSGYDELMDTGVNKIWAAARNITYVFFIVIMIVVGFMIMFRSKLGGQTLVTLGNTLPNIILALIGVTFSFAIAGIIIDIGGIIMSLLADIFREVGEFDHIITLESFFGLFDALVPQAHIETIERVLGVDLKVGGSFLGVLGSIGALTAVVRLIPFVGGGASFAVLVITTIIVIIATVGVVMVYITLIKAYIGILINVITGPFQIAMSAVPGKSVAFINWAKNIFRNVLIYPITFSILNLPALLYALSGGDINLPGPDQLTLGEQGPIANFIEGGLINVTTIFIFQILVLYLASKADKYAEAIIPPTSSREAVNAAQASQEAIGKIPLIGKLLTK